MLSIVINQWRNWWGIKAARLARDDQYFFPQLLASNSYNDADKRFSWITSQNGCLNLWHFVEFECGAAGGLLEIESIHRLDLNGKSTLVWKISICRLTSWRSCFTGRQARCGQLTFCFRWRVMWFPSCNMCVSHLADGRRKTSHCVGGRASTLLVVHQMFCWFRMEAHYCLGYLPSLFFDGTSCRRRGCFVAWMAGG